MKYFIDWEFLENGKTLIPISFGAVAEDGREIYLINKELATDFKNGEPYLWRGDLYWPENYPCYYREGNEVKGKIKWNETTMKQ